MTRTGLALALLLAMASAGLLAQTSQELYQQGLVQEHATGDLSAAVALYAQAARAAGQDRLLAVKALLRMAAAQEKLGRDADAADAYAEIVRAYPDQRAAAASAQGRLAALRRATPSDRLHAAPAPGAATTDAVSPARPLVERYCARCHHPGNRSGGLDLESISRRPVGEHTAVWESVARRLRARRDPPPGAPRPGDAAYRAIAGGLEAALDAAYATGKALPAAHASGDELAARLAAFLWNGAADAPLRDAAARGELHDPAGLGRQVERMLRDPKSVALVDGFFAPWLSLDRVKRARPDPSLYPEADADLLQAMDTETRMFLLSQLRDDRDAVELWTANYSFVNERLARHYGLPGISGDAFRRVTWPNGDRAGVLGQGGLLTALSMTTRTSPTGRGVYILTRFLGIDAPSPPANVPPLPERPAGPPGTMRDRMMDHKSNPSCASCHRLFDPLGLALERFDAVGRWRDHDGGSAIDSSGTFADGTRFDGPAGLRAGLLMYRDAYYAGVTQRLLAYALRRQGGAGRVYDYEMRSVRAVLRDASARGYRWSAILAGIAASPPFQARTLVP